MDLAKRVYDELGRYTRGSGVTTGTIRKLSAKLYREIEDKSINNVLLLCDEMLKENKFALKTIAFDWAFRVRKQYNENTFNVFENWLYQYIVDWGDCDDFCTHAFGHLISIDNTLFEKVKLWTKAENFAVRRAAAVVLIYPIYKDGYSDIDPFIISDILMQDEHYLVQKGYGWMLKVLSTKEPKKVIDYLKKYRDTMPRTAFRYALEKLDKEDKDMLMGR